MNELTSKRHTRNETLRRRQVRAVKYAGERTTSRTTLARKAA